jgi:uncharacterized protein YuzE
MKNRYLEVTFREGKPLAAYLHLPKKTGTKSARSEKAEKGMVVDFAESGEIIGVEITAPSLVTVDDVNAVLERFGQPKLGTDELSPLAA